MCAPTDVMKTQSSGRSRDLLLLNNVCFSFPSAESISVDAFLSNKDERGRQEVPIFPAFPPQEISFCSLPVVTLLMVSLYFV